ncbi:hypothetical protein CPT_Mater132 [Bacillus phage Mater]|uniref:Uncharacterized protein n=1 Tax=Bacillus phage Mater TaxID=1540090 RepID=A0A0A0RNS2_9CAUD|nr:hypothetical protein CPT_Mater132 [Bacillus phage Mater]AIW03289.1 hypothetical protein CPT_Mater132 [Bacillus phage Mater]
MKDNKLLQFIDDMLYFRKHGDKEGMAALLKEGEGQQVNMKDAAESLLSIVDDLTVYIDTVQAVDEVRLLTVIESLPLDIQKSIAEKFSEDEDDLINSKGENN